MQINESIENYLERILILQQQKGAAHAVDVAMALGVTKPSVSHAMKLLRENGYITIDQSNAIHLSDAGRAIAARMYERHRTLAAFWMRLGVPEEIAFRDACRMEHDISEETFIAIRKHVNTEP